MGRNAVWVTECPTTSSRCSPQRASCRTTSPAGPSRSSGTAYARSCTSRTDTYEWWAAAASTRRAATPNSRPSPTCCPTRPPCSTERSSPSTREGRPSFERLQARMHMDRPDSRLIRKVPVHYVAFDLPYLDGHALYDLPYEERRALLDGLELAAGPIEAPPYLHGGEVEQVRELQDWTAEQGLEGLDRQTAGLPVPAGPQSRLLAQGEELSHPGGRRRRLEGRQGTARGRRRLAAARRVRRAATCASSATSAPASPTSTWMTCTRGCSPWSGRTVRTRTWSRTSTHARVLGGPLADRRGRVLPLDQRRNAAARVLAWPAPGDPAEGGTPGVLTTFRPGGA